MEKMKMHTPDLTQDNIAKLAALFPNCVTEARDAQGKLKKAVDFDQLRQELSSSIVEGPQERYRLDWPGKREALLAANAPIAKTLRPCREESVDFDTTKNLFIEGDNLEALKLLQETYLGKVKLIYIDPPYNTGSDFLYTDDFSDSSESFFRKSNQIDESGNQMVANTEANGRFHSDWLTMMLPRLKLSKNLLKSDGLIVISIADHEIHNLRHIMDEVFGRENFIAAIIWQKVYAPKNSARHFSEDHDYLIIYAKNGNDWKPNLLPRTAEQDSHYSNPDNDPRGDWRADGMSARNYYSKGTYSITAPSGRTIPGPPTGRYWLFSEEKFKEMDAEKRIWWGADGNNNPAIKRFISEVRSGRVPQTLWPYDEVGHSQEAKKELIALIQFANSDMVFETPKPTRLLKRILQIATNRDESDLVLDFFSGTGTMQHSVMIQNSEDGGNRKCLLVQLPEAVLGASHGDRIKTIADIAKERIRAAGRNIKNGSPLTTHSLDVGFRVLRIDTSNMEPVFYTPDAIKQESLLAHIDNIRPGRTSEDLLFQVLLDWGVDLALPIQRERMGGKEVFFVDETALAACFEGGIDEEFVKALAKRKVRRAVFRDAGFASDAVKINVGQIFKTLSPDTEVKVI